MGGPRHRNIWRPTIAAAQSNSDETWLKLDEVFRGAVAAVRAQAAQKRLTLRMSMPADLPTFRANAGKLLQIMSALFLSAIENTPDHGQVSFDVERGDGCEITLSLSGTGNDLSPEQIDRETNPFGSSGSFKIGSSEGPGGSVTLRWRKK
jgi:signal transduction histidine kinase